ncbi:MAG: type II toxin-antitoxin system HipA family toxin [Deltaproteobacteria bacterium]|nr:type II toxin-antitoxin system HipA family toxin [Deltaproteobacteria bacterium]
MTSEAYIWIWLPGDHEPVICGKLESENDMYSFFYGRSYLKRPNAIALDPRELPLQDGIFSPPFGETHSVIRDAAPDAWGRRVLAYKSGGRLLSELDYLLLAGRDRIGALDIRPESSGYTGTLPGQHALIEDLLNAAEKVENGEPLPESLGAALLHGSSVGGARPKSLLSDAEHKWIAKFSSATDHYPVVRSEYAAMWLAGKCGIKIPDIELKTILKKDVLLVKRFDRERVNDQWRRRFLISGLTALQLHETEAPMASYPELASFIRRSGKHYPADVKQLFRRMVFNILIGNTDDHARNHAFFWDGNHYTLTPAYDICPLLRVGQIANQAMIVGKDGRESTLRNALSQPEQFSMTAQEAQTVREELTGMIEERWDEAADLAGLTKKESEILRQATILSPACFY